MIIEEKHIRAAARLFREMSLTDVGEMSLTDDELKNAIDVGAAALIYLEELGSSWWLASSRLRQDMEKLHVFWRERVLEAERDRGKAQREAEKRDGA